MAKTSRGRRSGSILPRTGFVLVTLGLAYIFLGQNDLFADPIEVPISHDGHRRLLQVNSNEEDANSSSLNVTVVQANVDPLFPKDLFTQAQLKHGAVVLHIFGIIYMFYALALVCDEFFVPALDVITEKLGISPDVAGATFMAAGGSAPELFTSVIGVFIAKSDVGIGTIVGSAVFNILFVIAACAFAAKEALSLTAWPLIRDVFFYSVSLIVLTLFFMDNHITWWEALLLFLWYFAYVGFMKFNEPVEDALRKAFGLPASNREGLERGVTLRKPVYRKGLYHLMNETINPGGILKKKHQKGFGLADGEELKPLKHINEGIVIGHQQAATGITGLKASLQPETRVENGLEKELDDVNAPQFNNPAASAGIGLGGGDVLNMGNNVIVDESGDKGAKSAENDAENNADDNDEEEPIDMCFPVNESWQKILLYLISFPIMAPLFVTLPDTKNKAKRKFFIITFVGSILWIALYSYLMVWWATVAGDTIGIPPPVMGLTFLAAGTSVPDLITSVLVAKQGKGDMAVSSSVGSNIFDVTVGLPFPWLLWSIANGGQAVSVQSEGVGCSVSLLFMMLILVFLSILIFRWRMTKSMGCLMLVLYFVFVVVTLGFTYKWYVCPL